MIGAFSVSLFTPIAVPIIGRPSLLFISLLALDLVRFLCCVLWKPAGFINRCPDVIPTNAENIDYPGTSNRRLIASTAQWRADWREHSVTRVLTSLCRRQPCVPGRHVSGMDTSARMHGGIADRNASRKAGRCAYYVRSARRATTRDSANMRPGRSESGYGSTLCRNHRRHRHQHAR